MGVVVVVVVVKIDTCAVSGKHKDVKVRKEKGKELLEGSGIMSWSETVDGDDDLVVMMILMWSMMRPSNARASSVAVHPDVWFVPGLCRSSCTP